MRQARRRAAPRGTAPRTPARVLATALAAVLAAGALAGCGDDGGPRADQALPGTVLLVPGYGGRLDGLTPLAQALRAQGRTVVEVDTPGDGTGDLREQATALDAAADAALAAGAPSVDVVGFSAGGVVARIWLDDLDGREVARRVVTLGTPHHGTRVAALAAAFAAAQCPQACQQLAPGSDLLEGLPEPAVPDDGPVLVSIWSEADDVVAPPSSSVLEGAVDVRLQSVCADDRTAHGALPASPLVAAVVGRALAAEPFVPPSAADCAALTGG